MTRLMLCAAVLTAAGVLVRDPLVRGQAHDAASVLAAAHEALGGDRNLAAVKTFVATGRGYCGQSGLVEAMHSVCTGSRWRRDG